jgi:hypothetical protein
MTDLTEFYGVEDLETTGVRAEAGATVSVRVWWETKPKMIAEQNNPARKVKPTWLRGDTHIHRQPKQNSVINMKAQIRPVTCTATRITVEGILCSVGL